MTLTVTEAGYVRELAELLDPRPADWFTESPSVATTMVSSHDGDSGWKDGGTELAGICCFSRVTRGRENPSKLDVSRGPPSLAGLPCRSTSKMTYCSPSRAAV